MKKKEEDAHRLQVVKELKLREAELRGKWKKAQEETR